jgi:hypothetical protein
LGLSESDSGFVFIKETTFKSPTIFENFVTLLSNVIFKGEVSFEKSPLFNKDTAGFAQIEKGERFVEVVYEHEYTHTPVVNISLNAINLSQEEFEKRVLAGDCTLPTTKEACEDALIAELLDNEFKYVITKSTSKGFVILLNAYSTSEIMFSWNALSVKDPVVSKKKTEIITSLDELLQNSPESTSSAQPHEDVLGEILIPTRTIPFVQIAPAP